jgi:hypothetical protein
MSGSNKIEQFLHESMTWMRLIDFFNQENSQLKIKLSEVVDKAIDKRIIFNAERFQNQFIVNDEFINDIGRDIRLNDKNLQLTRVQEKTPDLKACKIQEQLRKEMVYLEKEFLKLKNEFNQYILSIAM